MQLSARLRAMQFPDDTRSMLPGASIEMRVNRASVLTLTAGRSELFYAAGAADSHATLDAITVRYDWRPTTGWSASTSLSSLSYFDGNGGVDASAWVLAPVVKNRRASFDVGLSAAYRNTDETRFGLQNGKAAYDPYWTPRHLMEARAVLAAALTLRGSALRLHADLGAARDRALDLTNDTEFDRDFRPWRIAASLSRPLSSSVAVDVTLQRERSAYYEANELQLSLSRRF
jgi:hypothetical protein